MKVIVIGSGLIGLTSAYLLRKRGHDVTVIDRQKGPGLETSFANGALLTPSMPEPWNTPGCWRVLLASLGRSDSPLLLRLKTLPQLAGWGIAFLRNSSPAIFERNTVNNVRLALYSLKVMESLGRETHIEYGGSARGSLRVFRSSTVLDQALGAADHLLAEGLSMRRLSRKELVDLEPALAPIVDQLVGAIHYGVDQTGDAYRFCVALAEHARVQGVEFLFGTTISRLELRSGIVTAVQTNENRLVADQYVVAAGSYSTPLLHPLGIRLPVRPAKGYSVTFDLPAVHSDSRQAGRALSIPLVDDEMYSAVVPVGGAVRVAGTAEFAGFDLSLRRERVRNLINLAQKILPEAGLEAAAARAWCGLRPMSPDGVPIIGRTPIPNLWVCTGHGHLGWTMAAGSGQMLADLISGLTPSIDFSPYALRRFQ